MSTISVQVSALADLIVTSDTTLQALIFSCTPVAGGTTQRSAVPVTDVTVGLSTGFTVTDAGDYEITAQAMSAKGEMLGTPASVIVTVSAPTTITIKVPGAITASAV